MLITKPGNSLLDPQISRALWLCRAEDLGRDFGELSDALRTVRHLGPGDVWALEGYARDLAQRFERLMFDL